MTRRTSRNHHTEKNLTRYTRERTSFQGWRVCISRQGTMFTKYLPDRVYGGEEQAKAAALALRDEVLGECLKRPSKEVLEEYRAKFQKKPTDKKKQG